MNWQLVPFLLFGHNFLAHSTFELLKSPCYEDLGCFSMEDPWWSVLRPFPAPMPPEIIDLKIVLYTRSSEEGHKVTLRPEVSLEGSDFDPRRPATVFLTHGFSSNSSAEWVPKLRKAYLATVDANVFVVDWGGGATNLNYLQVASNTRVAGAELARFGIWLLGEGRQDGKKVHLIGHSLGSHVSSYMAKGIASSRGEKIARITGLDPAQPGFEMTPGLVRLTKGDADFVDVFHTDAIPFIPFLGFGMISPVGDVDFYFNGGSLQPGCFAALVKNITSIMDLAEVSVEVLSGWISCSHGRAHDYLISVLQFPNCTIWGRKMASVENIAKLVTLGRLEVADSLVESWSDCTSETCIEAGLSSPAFKARGAFAARTHHDYPFCGHEKLSVKELLSEGIKKPITGVRSTLDKILGAVPRPI